MYHSCSTAGVSEEVEEHDEQGNVKKVIKVTPKKTSSGMQAQLMCNYCNYTSPKRYLLTRHMKTHSEERPHKCNICDRGFKTVASLQVSRIFPVLQRHFSTNTHCAVLADSFSCSCLLSSVESYDML